MIVLWIHWYFRYNTTFWQNVLPIRVHFVIENNVSTKVFGAILIWHLFHFTYSHKINKSYYVDYLFINWKVVNRVRHIINLHHRFLLCTCNQTNMRQLLFNRPLPLYFRMNFATTTVTPSALHNQTSGLWYAIMRIIIDPYSFSQLNHS